VFKWRQVPNIIKEEFRAFKCGDAGEVSHVVGASVFEKVMRFERFDALQAMFAGQ
jgi:hypothetical protein